MRAAETHTHTHKHDNYRNPRCACAPRHIRAFVAVMQLHSCATFLSHKHYFIPSTAPSPKKANNFVTYASALSVILRLGKTNLTMVSVAVSQTLRCKLSWLISVHGSDLLTTGADRNGNHVHHTRKQRYLRNPRETNQAHYLDYIKLRPSKCTNKGDTLSQ